MIPCVVHFEWPPSRPASGRGFRRLMSSSRSSIGVHAPPVSPRLGSRRRLPRWLPAADRAEAPPPASTTPSGPTGSQPPRIAIVGAGMAGLNAAYKLKQSGLTATIFEGASRTGGRMFTAKDLLADGLTTELGGEFIDSNHDRDVEPHDRVRPRAARHTCARLSRR